MTDATKTPRCYTVPTWAKRELGADRARRYATEALREAKADGRSFEEACELAEQQLSDAADFHAMEEIEARACYYAGGIEA